MNNQQRDYLLKNYKTRSVKQLAEELKLDKKEIQRDLRHLLNKTADTGPSRLPQPAANPLWKWIGLAVILAITAAVYYQGLFFPFLNWDDPQYVTENTLIRTLSPANLKAIFTRPYFSLYIPFTLVSYALDYQFWHFNAFGYHLTNLSLHLLNVALVFGLVGYLTKQWAVGFGVALLFAIHPVQIESVIWVAERKNLLAALFFLLATASFVFSRRGGGDESAARKPALVLCFVFFIAACLAKPSAVILPLLVVAFDASRGYWKKEKAFGYLPFFAGALVFAMITYEITKGEGKMNYYGGSLSATLVTMMVVMMKYFQLLLVPVKQSLLYEFPPYPSIAHPHAGASFLALLFLFCAVAYLWHKDRKLWFWAAWYFIILLPVMNFVPFPSLMNDRYLYLPMIGFFTVLLTLLYRFGKGPVLGLFLLVSAAGFIFLNVNRQQVWAHSEKLWLETQTMTGEKHQSPYINLGMHYLREREIDKAVEQFEKVIAMFDDPKAYDGLGIAYFKKGDLEKSISYFKQAVAKAPRQAGVHSNLAMAYEKSEDYESALEEFKQAVSLDPRDPKFRNNLGSIYMKTGRDAEAEQALLDALKIDPDFADTLYNLGLLLSGQSRVEEARPYWSRLLAIHPDHPKAREAKAKMETWAS